MNGATLQALDLGAVRMRITVQSDDPLVSLCHVLPKSGHSWQQSFGR